MRCGCFLLFEVYTALFKIIASIIYRCLFISLKNVVSRERIAVNVFLDKNGSKNSLADLRLKNVCSGYEVGFFEPFPKKR